MAITPPDPLAPVDPETAGRDAGVGHVPSETTTDSIKAGGEDAIHQYQRAHETVRGLVEGAPNRVMSTFPEEET